MRVFFILLGKELRSFFLSPVAWVVLAFFMVISGFAFGQGIARLSEKPSEYSIVQWTFLSRWFYFYFFFPFPIITMRLFAEEQKLGTLESLLTAPVRTVQVLLAKYAAAVVFFIVLWIPNLLYLGILHWVSGGKVEMPHGAVWGSYLILLLTGFFHLAIGCLASALTKNQIVAAIICFSLILLHFLLGGWLLTMAENRPVDVDSVVSYLSMDRHMNYFTKGALDTRPMVYYLSFSALLLAFTHQILEYRRWKA
jgi:ABC-2 type transport system permease protein